MPEKDEVASLLAVVHREIEATIARIIRIKSPREDNLSEPIKLLEVNSATFPSGIWPIALAPDPPDVPHGSVVVEVTPDEYDSILAGDLALPNSWTLGKTPYP